MVVAKRWVFLPKLTSIHVHLKALIERVPEIRESEIGIIHATLELGEEARQKRVNTALGGVRFT